MTKEECAQMLNGRQYRSEMTSKEGADIKEAGLVVVFGASDDLMELRGAISDEADCYNGSTILLHSKGVLEAHDCDCEFCAWPKLKEKCVAVEALWDVNGFSWCYKTSIPHAEFVIVEDAELYCCGIVFEHSQLPTL